MLHVKTPQRKYGTKGMQEIPEINIFARKSILWDRQHLLTVDSF